jgi:hypothetical protein
LLIRIKIFSGIFPRNELAVAKAYRPRLGGFAGEFPALETQGHTLFESAGRYLAHKIVLWPTATIAVGALSLNHARTGLTGNSTNANLHNRSP